MKKSKAEGIFAEYNMSAVADKLKSTTKLKFHPVKESETSNNPP
jgi:hypothetical protein